MQLEPTSARLRHMDAATQVASKYTGIMQATRDIVREEGLPVSLLLPSEIEFLNS